jgi:rod shape-determining protein MreC
LLAFLRRNRVLLTSALCLLVAAGLAARTSNDRLRSDGLGWFFLEVMAPLSRGVTAARGVLGAGWRDVTELVGARDENRRLRARTRRLTERLDRLAELELENARLRKLLDFKDTLHGDLVASRVIGWDATGLAHTLTISRGTRDGIVKGAAVLAPEGVVGQVFLASRDAARVLLISDDNSGVDAIVQRTRARGILQGAEGACGLKYVKRSDDVQPGDMVLTSGLDGIFPKGLPIGVVVTVDKRGQGLFQYAQVKPRVDLEALEEVLVTRGAVTPAAPADGAAGAAE